MLYIFYLLNIIQSQGIKLPLGWISQLDNFPNPQIVWYGAYISYHATSLNVAPPIPTKKAYKQFFKHKNEFILLSTHRVVYKIETHLS